MASGESIMGCPNPITERCGHEGEIRRSMARQFPPVDASIVRTARPVVRLAQDPVETAGLMAMSCMRITAFLLPWSWTGPGASR